MQSLDINGASSIALPQIFGAGVAYQPMPRLTLIGDFYWINWSAYENLDFDFDPDVRYLPDKENPRNWENTIDVRFGAEYWITEQVALRAGYNFDRSPVPENTLGPELPCSDRNVITIGLGYRFKQFSIDLAYAHIFVKERTVDESIRDPQPLGDYEAAANVFGIGMSYAF